MKSLCHRALLRLISPSHIPSALVLRLEEVFAVFTNNVMWKMSVSPFAFPAPQN